MISRFTNFWQHCIGSRARLYDKAFWADCLIPIGETIWYFRSDEQLRLWRDLGVQDKKVARVREILFSIGGGRNPSDFLDEFNLITDTIYKHAFYQMDFGTDDEGNPLYFDRKTHQSNFSPLTKLLICSVVQHSWILLNEYVVNFEEVRHKHRLHGKQVKRVFYNFFIDVFPINERIAARRWIAYELMNGTLMKSMADSMRREWDVTYDHPERTHLYTHDAYEWVEQNRESLFGA